MINLNTVTSEGKSQAGPALKYNLTGLMASASASQTLHAPVALAPAAPDGGLSLLEQAKAMQCRLLHQPLAYTCRLKLKIGFFFDGTGNNLDADLDTDEHSNVARLFLAYPKDVEDQGIYKHYIPGLGTYFRDIGDIGDDDGAAFARYGDARLDKAMKWLDETIDRHSVDKIETIQIYLFGFSRGATLARAFARRIQERCQSNQEVPKQYIWPEVGKPFSIEFLGLFDTVASVGIPASAGLNSLFLAKKWRDLEPTLNSRRKDGRSGLAAQAFGHAAGADPTPNPWDGHQGWAGNLRVPPVVKRTVHLIAMNEIRNSFPLDTIWDGRKLPDNAEEIVYPGAHSNVGGGYRPGEGGKSMIGQFMLSKIPLRKMYDEAVLVGVPLLSLDAASSQADFAFDPELQEHFNETIKHAELTGGMLGESLLAHSKLYLKWRFRKIRLKLRAQDAPSIDSSETNYRKEKEGIEARIQTLENDPQRRAAEREMVSKQSAWQLATMAAPGHESQAEYDAYLAAKERFDTLNDPYLRERAKLRTLPSHDGELVGNLDAYDRQLMKDVAFLKKQAQRSALPVRPHYQALLEAHDDEFLHGKGLTDAKVIQFFDAFVHDSLAGFAKDVTLPSDPRCCYIGGDDELKYANHRPVRAVDNPSSYIAQLPVDEAQVPAT
ncbi:MAG: DUF2235 domain-containing protein [Aquabacterium sp.]|jgi:pimeloyl-ACP methyl ester carboxylesterase|uniref:T6SS phospholipase effector Tle1-like catalytic domain-containing protein n=1 Tax=Aquabacterium sp. TaxID=1872578 RepID=UPI002A36F057|nr:DUF2235 domain-containing protein [Aquabacterium sp.]MDX9843134.1 DUF2235 domain-containing protein [Aquabacterium sp.]